MMKLASSYGLSFLLRHRAFAPIANDNSRVFSFLQGGLKAVIWTDALQMVVMVTGFVAVLIQTSLKAGGIESLWEYAEEGGRIELWK